MELDAVNGIDLVLYRHDLAVLCRRGNAQTVGDGIGIGGKRMVARNEGGLGTAAEQRTGGVEMNLALLAVHELLCIGDRRAVHGTDRLMTETYAEDRDLYAELSDDLDDVAGVLRSARSRREDDTVGRQRADLFYRKFIVADDPDVGIDLSDVLVKVVGKAVVIVDQ